MGMIPLVAFMVVACVGAPSVVVRPPEGASDGKKTTTWLPGDDIPGWEAYDYDCPIDGAADVASVHIPDVWTGVYMLSTNTRYPDKVLAYVTIYTADCTEKACAGYSPDGGNPSVHVTINDLDVVDPWDKTGFYGDERGRPDATIWGSGQLPVGAYIAEEADEPTQTISICISRMRPDELSGVAYVTYHSNVLYHQYYPDVLLQYPFDLVYLEHAAWDYDYGGYPTEDLHLRSVQYYGDINYDNAWDWAAITDPDIRTAVYDRYTPVNGP